MTPSVTAAGLEGPPLVPLGVEGEAFVAQQRIVDAVNARKAALVEHAVGDLQTWQTQLRALANHLEDLEARSRAVVE